MNTESEARKLVAKQREHDRLLQEDMRERVEEEITEHNIPEATQEEARELIAEERKHAKQVRENMLHRANEQMNQ